MTGSGTRPSRQYPHRTTDQGQGVRAGRPSEQDINPHSVSNYKAGFISLTGTSLDLDSMLTLSFLCLNLRKFYNTYLSKLCQL